MTFLIHLVSQIDLLDKGNLCETISPKEKVSLRRRQD
jgi:hypothetical protein